MGSVPPFPHGRPLTKADLEAIPDDGHRYELVDGVLVMSPSPRPVHQRAVARLLELLGRSCPRWLEVLPAPVDVVLAEDTVLIPDVIVARREDFTDRALVGPPVLAVEVLSRSTRLVDLQLKRAKLAEAGCPHYWVVDPDEPSVRCFVRQDDQLVVRTTVVGTETAELDEPYPVQVSAQSLVSTYSQMYPA
ncbi:Uma2 family endonuclease [Amycolatopsis aidingensis]|uniref:Uma2 family endonuclease n=1 Tax=Amycolatopsis aidingensis TaxID=2842453 RepID=UPI001C0D90E7|nr:Uma2 family endonuclease [Amycolatopsis aidingensis]